MKKVFKYKALSVILPVAIFILGWFVFGHFYDWMNNSLCFKYLGCNAGFFGYDALVHYWAGLTVALFIIWVAVYTPKLNFFNKSFFKNCVILIALVALVGVAWEIFEYSSDRVTIYNHQGSTPLDVDDLSQPSNSDTMGDLTFDLLGCLTAIIFIAAIDKDYLIAHEEI